MKNRTPEPNARRRLSAVSCLLLALCAAGALLLSCGLEDIRGRGYISITTQPTGCEVYLDGELQPDTTNCVVDSVIKGQVLTLRLVKGDYLDYSDTVKVSGIDTLKLDFKFTGKLKVTSAPSGASITLDGTSTSKVTPSIFDSLIVGPHSLRLEKTGYASVDTSIGIFYQEQTDIAVGLNQQFGSIQVNSAPTGAAIWLDGSNTGYTTNHLVENVGVGSHELKLIKEGYVEWDTTVVVSENQTTTVVAILEEEEEPTGSIQINSTPTGATIYLDDVNTGKTTNSLLEDVLVGFHAVKLVKEGYVDWEQTVQVLANDTTLVNADLFATGGWLWVRSEPTGCDIYLDGEATGKKTDYLFEDLDPGNYDVYLYKEGLRPWEGSVTVTADDTVEVNARMPEGFLETFDTYTVGPPPPDPPWSFYNQGPSGASVEITAEPHWGDTGKSCQFNLVQDPDWYGIWFARNFEETTEDTFEFSFYLPNDSAGISPLFCAWRGDADDWIPLDSTAFACGIAMGSLWSIEGDYDSAQWNEIGPITSGEWHTLTIVFSCESETQRLYLDGADYGHGGWNTAFHGTHVSFVQYNIVDFREFSGTKPVYLDHISCSSPDVSFAGASYYFSNPGTKTDVQLWNKVLEGFKNHHE